MHTFLDAKIMARVLRRSLASRKIDLPHGDCLDIVARQFGLPNWNILAARIEAASASVPALALPGGWSITRQTDQRFYRLGLDPATPGTARIESRFGRSPGIELSEQFAAFMQSISATRFHGQRIRLTADLRTEEADKASLWMRVDRGPGGVLRFDNMLQRQKNGPLRGTAAWARRSIVLDVPKDAASIHYGFLLQGYGRVWARSFKLEAVGQEVPPTAGWGRWLPEPTNLDFATDVATAD